MNVNCSVLLFPPLNSYRRFLIHKLCEKFLSLGSFSISQGYDRRIVIYSRTNLNCNIAATTTSASDERWVSNILRKEKHLSHNLFSLFLFFFSILCKKKKKTKHTFQMFQFYSTDITKTNEKIDIRKTRATSIELNTVIKRLHQQWASKILML